MRVLSGIQPSGKLHLGNYFAMMQKMIEYQKSSELFCFVANLHALTTFRSKEEMEQYTLEAAMDFLALGLDPEKSVFWIQSDVPEVCELTWYLSTVITVPHLSKAHSYKDKQAKGILPSAGLFNYPVLMAADILAFDAGLVPVGQDQKQHLEMTRDIAQAFNTRFGDVLVLPEADIDDKVRKIPGVDGEKMSKSYNNTINLFESDKKLKKQVFSIKTDSKAVEDAKDPEDSVLFDIFELFLNEDEKKELAARFRAGGTGYGDFKKELLERVLDFFGPFRDKRGRLGEDPGYVKEVLADGAARARAAAQPVLERVRAACGLKYMS